MNWHNIVNARQKNAMEGPDLQGREKQEYAAHPKSTKKGTPLKPTVNCIASPTYDLAKYLAGQLKP
jgi:hypothetical protein